MSRANNGADDCIQGQHIRLSPGKFSESMFTLWTKEVNIFPVATNLGVSFHPLQEPHCRQETTY